MSHQNQDSPCLECARIFNRYPGFSELLRTWFFALQIEHPEAHISCAGRGQTDQEAVFARKASKAHWLQSAHNFNAALDLWENRDGVYTLDPIWFNRVVGPALYPALQWYGTNGAPYFELPHVELRQWKSMRDAGILVPVET